MNKDFYIFRKVSPDTVEVDIESECGRSFEKIALFYEIQNVNPAICLPKTPHMLGINAVGKLINIFKDYKLVFADEDFTKMKFNHLGLEVKEIEL